MLFCRCPGRREFAGALARPRLPSWPQAKENLLLNGHAACHQSKARDPVGVPKVTVLAECMCARPCGRAVRKSAQRAAHRRQQAEAMAPCPLAPWQWQLDLNTVHHALCSYHTAQV